MSFLRTQALRTQNQIIGLITRTHPLLPKIRGLNLEQAVPCVERPLSRLHEIKYADGKPWYLRRFEIEEYTRGMHALMRDDGWNGRRNQKYETLDHEMKLNYTLLFLLGNIAYYMGEFKDLSLPERIPLRPPDRDTEYWMGTPESWWDRGDLNRTEVIVKWHLEEAWRNRHPKYPQYFYDTDRASPERNDALRWENTTICLLEAVYSSISSLGEIDADKIKIISEKANALMIEHKLWGKDNKNSDRAYEDGRPKPFNELSPEMQENYVLLVLATLSGISDYKAKLKSADKVAAKQI